jgi:Mn2+/Fe2+ NRAMP family transporter
MNTVTKKRLLFLLYFLGPGWIAMMADVDAPSVFTAIVAGEEFKFAFIIFLIILIIPLYLYQEAVARIGILTKKGLAELIKNKYGKGWSMSVVGTMFFINMLSYVAEFAGISAAGLIFGVPIFISVILVILGHTFIVFTGSYKKVENILIFISLLLFIFIITAITTRPNVVEIATGLFNFSKFNNLRFITLVLGLTGAVIMPWMLFYQQSAVVDKKLSLKDLKNEKRETLIGAIISEGLMTAIVITAAMTIYGKYQNMKITSLAQLIIPLAGSFSPYIFAIGIIACGFLAGVVVSLSSAWSISEYFGWSHSLNMNAFKAKKFYFLYLAEILPAAIVPIFYNNLINIIIDSMVLNAVILPILIVFIILISSNKSILHNFANSLWRTAIMWLFTAVIILSTVIYIILSV